MDSIDRFRHLPLFEGLPEDQIQAVQAIAQERTLARGELVFSEGDEGTGFYMVADGRIKIFKLSPEGKEQILHIFGPGEPFGEVAMFAGRHFPAYAEAIEKSAVLFFPRLSLSDLISRNPALALNMLGVLSLRLRRFTNLIEDLSLKEVPGRLAAYLLILSQMNQDASDLDLDVSKGQLASLLGTIPETLSRILARMSQQDLIQVDGRRISILDRTALEQLSTAERRLT
ncbi:MAG: Crp/Fnr family transcriptional regulator [Proteobacteria bacterium]|nr:Crp/Fnr family transcriptional regulator [Pseudomonadota bacterium]